VGPPTSNPANNSSIGSGLLTLPELDNITHLSIGNGLFLTALCRRKEYVYGVEEDYTEVINAKKAWKNNPSDETYATFIDTLESALGIEEEE
jgi:hypothetical protein